MVWLLDGYALERTGVREGWRRVALSRAVWERCIVPPKGLQGQNEDARISDLLCFLRLAIRSGSVLNRLSLDHAAFVFSVLNDNRDWDDCCDWLPTEVQLVASRSTDDYGAPAVLVTLPHEDR